MKRNWKNITLKEKVLSIIILLGTLFSCIMSGLHSLMLTLICTGVVLLTVWQIIKIFEDRNELIRNNKSRILLLTMLIVFLGSSFTSRPENIIIISMVAWLLFWSGIAFVVWKIIKIFQERNEIQRNNNDNYKKLIEEFNTTQQNINNNISELNNRLTNIEKILREVE